MEVGVMLIEVEKEIKRGLMKFWLFMDGWVYVFVVWGKILDILGEIDLLWNNLNK